MGELEQMTLLLPRIVAEELGVRLTESRRYPGFYVVQVDLRPVSHGGKVDQWARFKLEVAKKEDW